MSAAARGLRPAFAAVLLLVLAGCGSGGSKQSSAPTTTDANGCIPVEAPGPTRKTGRQPTTPLSPAKTYDVTLHTNCGSFTIRLAVKTSPNATASFVALARTGYFDNTLFHRIIPDFVFQGGDPTGTGTGGPGYTTVDPPPASTRYTFGTAAMAKGAVEPSGTAGSQFFVVTAPQVRLPPEYAVLGRVVRGLAVVKAIGKLGDSATGNAGTPTETVVLQKATVHVG